MTMRSALQSSLSTPRLVTSSARRILGGAGLVLALGSCSGDTVKPYEPVTDPSQLYMDLVLNAGAVTLSTAPGYDTFQLTATTLNALGEPMPELPTPTFRHANPNDSTRVTLSPSGLLTALTAASNVPIIAEVTTSDNVHHADTAFVNVNETTDPPPALATLTLNPGPPDSTLISENVGRAGNILFWVIGFLPGGTSYPNANSYRRALDAGGNPIPNLATEYFSLDPTVLSIDRRTGQMNSVSVGPARIVVKMVAYGVIKADTTVFTVTMPAIAAVQVLNRAGDVSIFGNAAVIRPGGVVFWWNRRHQIDVVFDDPSVASIPNAAICTAATAGFRPDPNACATHFTVDSNKYRARQFFTPGIYTYHDTFSGAVGKVVVTDSLFSF